MTNNSKADGPRILSIDIETSPVVAHAWGLHKQNIAISQVIERPRTICFAAKFLGERKVHFHSEFHQDNETMVRAAHALLSEADIVLHYNGDRFDLPRLNLEFLMLGLTPPAPYRSVDLYKVTKQNFQFVSNKLAWVSEQLGLAGKIQHSGHNLWTRCLAGDPKAWAEMKRYNIQDTRLLEEMYDKLLPWIKNHPNMALYRDEIEDVCTNCGGDQLIRQGTRRTQLGRFQRFQCKGCGTWVTSTRRIDGATMTQARS